MKNRKKAAFPIRIKLNIIILAVTLVSLSVISVITWSFARDAITRQVQEKIETVADMIAYNAGAALMFHDRQGLSDMLSSLRIIPDIKKAAILNVSHDPVVSSDFSKMPDTRNWTGNISYSDRPYAMFRNGTLAVARPVIVNSEQVGMLYLETGSDILDSTLDSLLTYFSLAAFSAVLLAVLLGELLQHIISRPIQDMADTMYAIAKDRDYTRRVDIESNDETGVLADSFNRMLGEIQERDEHLEALVRRRTVALEEAVATAYRLAEEAEEANMAKSRFLATVSHELRTPLNAVIGMTQLVMKTELDSKQKHYLVTIHTAAETLLMLINDILDLSKIESGQMTLDPHPFDLRSVMEKVTVIASRAAAEKDINIVCKLVAGTPEKLVGDSLKLHQVLVNLVGNAVKFTESGHVMLEASEDMRPDGASGVEPGHARISFRVCDTGIGIREDNLDKIFESFVQSDDSMTRKYGGTGLGLAISRKIVELMGGSISVKSEYGKGSEFSFSIDFLLQDGEKMTVPESPVNCGKVAVLLADDDEWERDAIRQMLHFDNIELTDVHDRDAFESLIRRCDDADKDAARVVMIHESFWKDREGFPDAVNRISREMCIPVVVITGLPAIAGNCEETDDCMISCLVTPVFRDNLFRALRRAACRESIPDGDGGDAGFDAASGKKISGVSVLVAEDIPVNQELVRNILDGMGYHAVIVEDGMKALEAMAEESFDMVLMDIQMPVMDGLTAARIIRAIEQDDLDGLPVDIELAHSIRDRLKRERIPVIAMTAHTMSELSGIHREEDMDDVITKPFHIKDFCAVVEKYAAEAEDDGVTVSRHAGGGDMGSEKGGKAPDLPVADKSGIMRHLESAMGIPSASLDRIFKVGVMSVTDNMNRLEEAVQAMDYQAIHRAGHALKSAVGALGLSEHQQYVQDMERSARNAVADYPYKDALEMLKRTLSPLIQ